MWTEPYTKVTFEGESMNERARLARRIFATSLTLTIALFGAAVPAQSARLKTLHGFCAKANCTDGKEPLAKFLQGSDGTLYGTTFSGGTHGGGTAFALVPSGIRFKFTVLYDFCKRTGCADGANPEAGLIADSAGDLYGTTDAGGSNNQGAVFELVPNADRTRWTEQTLYSFCSASNCTDGAVPNVTLSYKGALSGAPYDGTSPLFGTTQDGGSFSHGASYEILFVSGKTKRKEKVLYNFCSDNNCADGDTPSAEVVDDKGNIFGATDLGGANAQGTLFELDHRSFAHTVLYSFCPKSGCSDGAQPFGPITLDTAGNVLGTTQFGGGAAKGVLFTLTPNGINSQESVLYSFCQQNACADGQIPNAGVTIAANGDLFGTTQEGGATGLNAGVVFQLHGKQFKVLYSFCSEGGCTDGASPQGVVLDAAGHLFGVADSFGPLNGGTAFELIP